MQSQTRHHLAVAAALAVLLALTWTVYSQSLPGFFKLDDYDNLAAMRDGVTDLDSLQHYLEIGNAGPLGRPIAKLTFLLDDNAWPSEPAGFHRTNLLLHLLAAVLVFAVCRLMFQSRWPNSIANWAALAVAAFWMLHPLNVSTAAYVVQRMTQLAAIFVLAGTLLHLWLRQLPGPADIRRLLLLTASLGLFTALAAFSKESGILLPVFLLVIEFTVLAGSHQSTRLLRLWRWVCLALPTLALLGYLAYLPRWVGSYANRDFTLWERLATQPVVLVDYLGKIFSTEIYGVGVFQDDFPIYSGLLSVDVIVCTAMILVAVGLGLSQRLRYPMLSLGILWFFSGHLLESTTISLEIYFEHRNYLPMIGPLILIAALMVRLAMRLPADIRRWLPVLVVGLLGVTAFKTLGLAQAWQSESTIIPLWAIEHPDSPRAQRTYAYQLAGEGHPLIALDILADEFKKYPGDITFPVMSVDIACLFGLEPQFDFTDLASRAESFRWTNAIRPTFNNLYERIERWQCPDQRNKLQELVYALPGLEQGEVNRRALASIFTLHAERMLAQRQGNAAIDALIVADQLAEKPDTAIRVADVLISVRNFDAARQWLTLAKTRETDGARSKADIDAINDKYARALSMVDNLEHRARNADGEPSDRQRPGT